MLDCQRVQRDHHIVGLRSEHGTCCVGDIPVPSLLHNVCVGDIPTSSAYFKTFAA
jgi:hypothetical protein